MVLQQHSQLLLGNSQYAATLAMQAAVQQQLQRLHPQRLWLLMRHLRLPAERVRLRLLLQCLMLV
jgi:hypothetical protein